MVLSGKRRGTNEERDEESWVSPWGAAAFVAGALALLQASVPGLWWLTVALAALGVLLVGQGIRATWPHPRATDRTWLVLGGGVSGVVLLVALAAPWLLNNWWAIDTQVALSDPDAQVVVPRDVPLDKGRRPSADDWADAVTEAIRQDDLFVRVESVKSGPRPGKAVPASADGSCLMVYLRLLNCKHERTISVEGFKDTHQPVLTDDTGHSYAFLGQRRRRPAKGGAGLRGVRSRGRGAGADRGPGLPADVRCAARAVRGPETGSARGGLGPQGHMQLSHRAFI